MHMHRFEKIWLIFGVGALLLFLTVLGVSAFYLGNQPPSCLVTIDPEQVDTTAPFNKPGLNKVEGKDWDYELVYVASAFSYNPVKVEVPLGSTVKVMATTKDVIHGFEVTGTNINMMLEPGYVSEYVAKFDKAGEFLIICNEYCGAGHHMMSSRIEVVEK
ncbi:cytochrome c oxidase subunit II [Peribacillus psychrosaccharolyticus]|uniref:Cytochrome aa3 subunit 2 n=1 Tax=Peribacillus psychrosaccharolyticus TaxID=1407 RepID=A0A974NMD7_PERPY|nr:cytochrome c oxidase subunit II [Peribacillus psychrosaccharolyticus]MEC2056667.1 cytochrome c oxidase subunit II [Peribacillus psychrosaccharolyticus]MED3746121.1 cytochrome c oxidase subunit II [Peribacillus psychrosaccharolyticus]QQT00203.1 cytochrome c oxidase subunit II [Peribacillus psychrosaccharolyticus]